MSIYASDAGREALRKILNKSGAHIHFIGILGAGMSPLAELLHLHGCRVTGTDRDIDVRPSDIPEGAVISRIQELSPPDAVVYTLAVGECDAELLYARKRGIPTVTRAELLGAVMLSYDRRIGISGTHGKSTVTAIFDAVLRSADIPHTTVSGAKLPSGSALFTSGGEVFLFEACEYRNSFLSMSPTAAVITNIEFDHPDFFRDEEHFYSSFETWAMSARDLLLIGEGKYSARLSSKVGKRAYVYGESGECDFSYSEVEFSDTGTDFSFNIGEKTEGRFHISALGLHNVKNAAAALSYAALSDIPMEAVRSALSGFRGIGRRLELLGYIADRAVYYDYAHHPTEIVCTLDTLKRHFGKVTAIFRPHTYSRTAALFGEFRDALARADSAVILDIYPAREEPIEGVTAERLAEAVGESAVHLDFSLAVSYTLSFTEGAVVLMGAGEVEALRRELIDLIENDEKNKYKEL